jgi:hypothetical protein
MPCCIGPQTSDSTRLGPSASPLVKQHNAPPVQIKGLEHRSLQPTSWASMQHDSRFSFGGAMNLIIQTMSVRHLKEGH